MADVVPLHRRSAPQSSAPGFGEPAEFFVDAADPALALSLTWSPDQQVLQLSIETPTGPTSTLVLDVEDVLDLVRALVEGLPDLATGCPRPPAPVLPLTPRPTQD